MYKALIIDDENPVRMVIKALGSWQEFGIDYVYEAFEGESALEIMRQNKPEIVFLDMKMPNMDGVEFLKYASKEYPRSKYIVVSGYDDFEYTKQAIKAKVSDYLLKPVVEDELNAAISKVVEELNEENTSKIEKVRADMLKNSAVSSLKERIMLFIYGNDDQLTGDEEIKITEMFRNYGSFSTVIYSVINIDEVCRGKFEGDKKQAFKNIIERLNKIMKTWGEDFCFKHRQSSNEIIAVCMCEEEDSESFKKELVERSDTIIRLMEEEYGAFCIACIGEMCIGISGLRNSYNSAEHILERVNVLNCSARIFEECDSKHKRREVSLMDKKKLLIYAIESGSMDYTKKILDEYFEGIKSSEYLSREDLYLTSMEFIQIVDNIADKLGITVDQRRETSFIKLEDFSSFVYKTIEKIFSSIQMRVKANQNTSLYEIKNYIDNNYGKEIKVSRFSEIYYTSKEYLSKQFKAEFGFGIYEYVLKVRMEKAKEMLGNKSVKISAIAEQLGYNNNNYFSNAFKNYFGMSPTEYREKINNTVKK